MKKATFLVTVFILGLIFAGGVFAEDKKDRLIVTSDKQSIDYTQRLLVYEGNAKVVWREYTVEAEKVQVFLTKEDTLEKVIAEGEVKISQGEKMQGFCQKVTYLVGEGILVFEGDVVYQDERENKLQAQKVTVWIKEKKLQAEGSPVTATYILGGEEENVTGGE